MNAPAVKTQPALPALQMSEHELMSVLQNSLYPGAQESSIKMVMGYCKAAGLDPMQKPVHIVPMYVKDGKNGGMRDVVMPGIGLYRTQAARSGCYAGMTEPEFGEDVTETLAGTEITYPRWCKITVKRTMVDGQVAEFTAKEFWKENYATASKDTVAPNAMWRRRPYAQLSKCSEAQALRKAFPEIGAAPTAEEMEGKPLTYEGETIDGSTGEIINKTPPAYSDEEFKKNLPSWKAAIAKGARPDAIIAKVSTKGTLTEEQKAAIRAPVSAEPPVEDLFAQVKAGLEKAQSLDALDLAADLIKSVADEQQRAELSQIYQQRLEDLT